MLVFAIALPLARVLIFCALALVLPSLLTQARATAEPIGAKADVVRKIKLSNRQRMLSQLMAKAACIASLGVDTTTQTSEMRFAHYLFGETLLEFRTGSFIQNTLPEYDSDILAAFDVVDVQWDQYGPAVLNKDLPGVSSQDAALLEQLDLVATLYQRKYATAQSLDPSLAAALIVSGRQGMLTQKAAKEFCLIAARNNADENRERLKSTMALLETSLQGLELGDGSLGLQAAPAGEIIDQIAHAKTEWSRLCAVLSRVAEGGAPLPGDIAEVSIQNLNVLQAMNLIADIYELLRE